MPYKLLGSGGQSAWRCARFSIRYKVQEKLLTVFDPSDAAKILYSSWDPDLINIQEQTAALYLNHRFQALAFQPISTGNLRSSSLDLPLLLIHGLLTRAHYIVIAHNHPSGDPTPSKQDIRLTQQVQKSISLVGMELYDHIILAKEGWHSMAESRNIIPDWKLA